MAANVIDASKSGVSILILHEQNWDEFYNVVLPPTLGPRQRKAAEAKLSAAGFRAEYRFDRKIVDKRSMSLAKAQAASMVKRILDKTGLKLEVGHGIEVAGAN